MNTDVIASFKSQGFVKIEDILVAKEVEEYRSIYEDFLQGRIVTDGHRSDLSGSKEDRELIVQIMRPSLLLPSLMKSTLHKKALAIAKELLGEDMELDFDMLIDKSPFTDKETPFHQDEAYWLSLDDKRAVSCWIALDDVVKENGCMWFVPESHVESLRPHTQIGNAGALKCEGNEAEALAVEMKAGSCTFHHGRTLHYTRGNSTERRRRAFILNFRPAAMIAYERAQGYDHLGGRKKRIDDYV